MEYNYYMKRAQVSFEGFINNNLQAFIMNTGKLYTASLQKRNNPI